MVTCGFYNQEMHFRAEKELLDIGIPVPVGFFPFAGHKASFFGDLHCLGKDSYRFFTESKCVTTRWFDEEDKNNMNISTWDGRFNCA